MARNKDEFLGNKWGKVCCIASFMSIIRSAIYLAIVVLGAYNLRGIKDMSELFLVPDNVLIGFIITVVLTSIIFGVFWAIRSYTEYNAKHEEDRGTNPYKLNYAIGTAVAIGLAGLITFGVTVIIVNKVIAPDAETWTYCVFAGLLAFVISGFMVKAIHMGIETAIKWLGQGVKKAASSAKDLAKDLEQSQADLAEAKALLGEAMVQINALKAQNTEPIDPQAGQL